MILTGAENISVREAGLDALLGYAVVFFGLILLMLVVILVGKFFTVKGKKAPAAPAAVPETAPNPVEAPGAAGSLKLHSVDPKTAAILMAITADKLQKPINRLRFISIREVSK